MENSLLNLNLHLSKEWNYNKNGDLLPENVTLHSNKKVWWICDKDHEWEASVNNRSKGSNCPYCSGKKATKETCLATINPNLSKQWHPFKNGTITPNNVTANSHKKVWWTCDKGHEWESTVKNRNNNRNCPKCSSCRQTSFQENAILFYLKNVFQHINSRHQLYIDSLKTEADIYIKFDNTFNKKPIVIEYDGYYYHKDKLKEDIDKHNRLLKDNFLIVIREYELPKIDTNKYTVIQMYKRSSNLTELNATIKKIFDILKANDYISAIEEIPTIDCNSDTQSIYSLINYIELENSFASRNDELLSQWNYSKNEILPTQLSSKSGKRVWWICDRGHEWQTTIPHRLEGTNCPYCSGKKACKENCLATVNPELANQWHTTKNGNLTPRDVTPNSHKKVWWICDKGHEWQATISHRSNGRNCPYCSHHRVTKESSLLNNSKLLSEWNFPKNIGVLPKDFSLNSNKKVWWICNKEHEWKAAIYSRNSGKNCPYCHGRIASTENCLATANPGLAAQWHPVKNGTLTPSDVTPNSHKKAWWKCPKGHEWEAEIKSRNRGCNCPYCSNHYSIKNIQ